ncbi:MAG: lamin tail domain-containing protein [Sedimentisphaerales bacterium]|nr:lamin tail domain-containing protein [Sedimentisphaerales bacterium]
MRTHKQALVLSAVPVLLWAGLIGVYQVSVVHADGGLESAPVVINELLASNVNSTADPQGEFDDWIELYNVGDIPVDIGGMYLTDDTSTPTKWQIPLDNPGQTTIPPHGYLLVWADKDDASQGLHAAFSLNAGGEEIALTDVDGTTVIDSVRFGPQRADVSYGRYPDGSTAWSLMAFPTAGSENIRPYEGFVEEPQISPGHGFHDSAVQVTIACDTPEVAIYYTTDGSDPYLTNGARPSPQAVLYAGPVQISRTTCLRAVATRAGWKASPVETQTYLFAADVARQSPGGQSPGPAWPSGSVNGQVIDYGMDPDVVNAPSYKNLIDDALLSIPSVSLVTDLDNLFDPAKGIYVNAGREGRDWERPVSVELICPDGSEGFQINAGIRIRGGFSRTGGNPKHSFRLFFRSEYGPPALKYALFGAEGADEFENLDLRTAQNYAWSLQSSNPGEKNTFIREVLCRDLQRETGKPYTRSRYYHLYINGQYWGLYQSQERSEASYAATYFGGEDDDYDVVKADNYRTSYTDGSIDDWNLLWTLCQRGFESDLEYYAVQGKRPDGTDDPHIPVHVDVENLIDYMIGIFFTGNDDAPVTLGGSQANNFFAVRNRRVEARDGWKFFAYDNEHSLGVLRGLYDDRTGPVSAGQSRDHFNPQWLHQKLMAHPEYRMRFADHTQKHFFNGGAMTPEKAIALCLSRAGEIDLAIIAESARWGDQRPSRASNPYTKADWWNEVNGYLASTYFPARTQIVLDQLRNRGLYPQVEAPAFYVNDSYQHGGYISSTDTISMTGGGTVWYTLDGTDPRLPGMTGEPTDEITLVAAGASKRVYVPAGPVNEAWKGAEAFDDSDWTEGTGGVGYERSSGYQDFFDIDVESRMYGTNTTCYIRTPFNLLAEEVDDVSRLALRIRYDDGFVAYLNGTEVARKNFVGAPAWDSPAAAQNSDAAAVSFEELNITAHAGRLQRGRNILAIQGLNLSTSSSDFLISVELVSSREPEGGVPADVSPTAVKFKQPLVLEHSAHLTARALAGTTWSALSEAVFAAGPVAQSLRLSEIMYHPQDTGDPNDSDAEYIELTNIGSELINLNLVRFSDGVDFIFPSVTLGPDEYVLVVKDRDAFEARYGPELPVAGEYSGSLSNAGERIELLDAVGTTIHAFSYEDNWHKTTDGQGYSLTVTDPHGTDPNDLSDGAAWRPSLTLGGSPGWDETAEPGN